MKKLIKGKFFITLAGIPALVLLFQFGGQFKLYQLGLIVTAAVLHLIGFIAINEYIREKKEKQAAFQEKKDE